MHRAIILITICFYTIFLPFTQASEVNKEGRRIVKRKIDSLADFAIIQDNGQAFQSPSNRSRTESEVTTTTTATTTETASNLLGALQLSPGAIGSSSGSLTNSATGSFLSADIEADKIPELDTTGTIVDSEAWWDSFEFDLGVNLEAFSAAEGRLKAQEGAKIEENKNGCDQISKLVTEPFRADYDGRTVIIIPNGENMEEHLKKYEGFDYILHDDFLYHLMNLCSLNHLFEAVSMYKKPHFLNETELAAIELDESSNEYVISDGTNELRRLPFPPLHPLYALAREVVFYNAAQGKTQYIKEAIDAGMNMNFIIHLKNKKLKMNLLQFLLRFAKKIPIPIPIIELLVKDAKIDVNAYDSDGLSVIHYIALNDANGPFETIFKACSGAINLNAPTKCQTFLYPIHLAAYSKSYRFLKPFIYLPTVDINVLDHQWNHLLHYAINLKSFGFFSDLLKHPKLVLQFDCVKKAFTLIKATIPIEDSERYLDVFTAYLMERNNAYVSHLHFITFYLITTQYIQALESFQKNNFDFTFIHKSSHSRPDSSVISVAAHFDRLESFKFLQRALPVLKIDVFIFLAIRKNAHKIIEFLLETDQINEASLKEILELIIKIDDSTSFHLFSSKFGQEKIFTFINSEDIDFVTCPGIFMYQLLH